MGLVPTPWRRVISALKRIERRLLALQRMPYLRHAARAEIEALLEQEIRPILRRERRRD